MVEAKCDAPVTGQCPPGEQFTTCSTMCESTCGDDPFAPCIEMCGPPKCQCMSGYSRDVNGRCIPRRDCLNTITTRPTASSPCRAGGLVNGEGGVQVVTETGSVTSIPRGAIGTGCGVLAGQITIEGSGYVLTTQGGTSISLTVASQKIKTPQGTLRIKSVPTYSCEVYGCLGAEENNWQVAPDGSSTCLYDFELQDPNNMKACFCDDSCTQWGDCCEDYQALCIRRRY
jgi:hypothetical protein